jgi:hypothetical protein
MFLNKNKIIILGLVIVLGIFIYILNDNSFTSFSIFTNIYCENEEFIDHLIILQSVHDYLVVPINGYDIVNEDVFLDMFFNRSGKLGYIQCSDGAASQWFKGPVVYFIEVNNIIHTVHPYLFDLLFEMFRIND